MKSANKIVQVFMAADPLLRQTGESKWWNGAIVARTWRRWQSGQSEPEFDEVSRVGIHLWDSIRRSNQKDIWEIFCTRLVKLVPDARNTEWCWASMEGEDSGRNRILFGEWCGRLSETTTGDVYGNRTDPNTDRLILVAEVLVAAGTNTTLAEFRPLAKEILPVKGGQWLRIHVEVKPAAFLYVCWITPRSSAEPNFPWVPGQWNKILVNENKPMTQLDLPYVKHGGKPQMWAFNNMPGWESLVILARKDPMSDEAVSGLREKLEELPVPVKNVRMDPGPYEFDLRRTVTTGRRLDYRAKEITDPVLERHMALVSRLGGRCDAGKCLTFFNAG